MTVGRTSIGKPAFAVGDLIRPKAGWLGDPNEILTGRVIRYAPRTRCTAARNYAPETAIPTINPMG
jgi:hypothetical protein